jgi:hypothetical protein
MILLQIPTSAVDLEKYISKFCIKIGEGKRTEYFQINYSHIQPIRKIEKEIREWFAANKSDLFPNML